MNSESHSSSAPSLQPTLPSSISHLPDDLQSYLVSFNSSRSNVKTFALINSHWKQVVERHVKRRVWNSINGNSRDALGRRRERSRLVFEAQRPIDTVTAKHALHFSHFSQPTTNSSTLSAHFAFVPPPPTSEPSTSRTRSRSFSGAFNNRSTSRSTNDSSNTMNEQDSLSRPNNFNAPHDAQNAVINLDQPYIPGVPEDYVERMGKKEVSSSVFQVEMDDEVAEIVSGTSTPRFKKDKTRGRSGFNSGTSTPLPIGTSTSASSNHTEKLFTHVSKPLVNNDVRVVPDDGEELDLDSIDREEGQEDGVTSSSDEEDTDDSDDSGQIAEGLQNRNSDNIHQPLNAYDWAGPASSFVGSKYEDRTSRRRPKIKPTYRFELDALDSFETWILTLAIHKPHPTFIWSLESNHSSLHSQSLPQKIGAFTLLDGIESGPAIRLGPSNAVRGGMRWEKRVAEGLERVYREWHLVDRLDDEDVAEEHGKSKGKGKDIPPPSKSNKRSKKSKFKSRLPKPPTRILEFDGDQSCVLEIQPHPIERLKLPSSFQSYDSGYGASYYGNSSYPYAYGLSSNLNHNFEQDKTTLTFHCEEIKINAHRLLSTLEELEKREMNEMDKELERMGQMKRSNDGWLNQGQFIVAGVTNTSLRYGGDDFLMGSSARS